MNTRSDISTISYNSIPFLLDKLNYLYNNHKISDFMFIQHKAEDDELKDHIHLFLSPNKQLDTMTLQEILTEFNVDDPAKPFKCINFRKSKIDDWILYNLHDTDYLLTKGETRRYHYDKNDIFAADLDNLEYNYYHAFHCSKFAEDRRNTNLIFDFDKNKADLIRQGRIPIGMASQLLALDHLQRTYRGYHENHQMSEEYKQMFANEEKAKASK